MRKSDFISFLKQTNTIKSRKVCFASDISYCSREMSNAHTIQRKRSLESIAENSHVCGFINNENLDSEDLFVFSDNISVNHASTFHGFCQKHDNELFKDIDTGYFVANDKQVYLLMFRTIAWQLYNNISILKTKQKLLGLYQKEDRQLSDFEIELFLGKEKINCILNTVMRLMNDAIKKGDYSSIQYLVIQTSTIPDLMTSGSFIPENFIPSLSENDKIRFIDVNLISLNILSDSKNGYIVFSWLTDYKHNNENYLSKLIQCNDPLHRIMEICFYQLNENIYFSKKWWDCLLPEQKELLLSIIRNTPFQQGIVQIEPKLKNIVDWKITSWKTNNQTLSKILT